MLIGMSVSCEKQDWFSPEDVDALKAQHQAQLNDLTFANNTLTTSAADLTTQVATLTTTVETLQAEIIRPHTKTKQKSLDPTLKLRINH